MIKNYYINKLKYELKGDLIQFIRKLLQRGNDYAHVPIYYKEKVRDNDEDKYNKIYFN